jgi:two-component system, cell cycle response regulator DivK
VAFGANANRLMKSSAPSQVPQERQQMLALLVDRDLDTRAIYAEWMKLGAWDVEEATDGREALAKAIARRPNVIVTETNLPGMSGYDLCLLLKRDSATNTIPILVLTGDPFAENLARVQNAGADSVLVKPCPPETLLAEVRRIMTSKAKSGELRSKSAETRGMVLQQLARSEELLARSRASARKLTLSRALHRHETMAPPTSPPSLICPQCDQALIYLRSHIGGVSARHPEQWDYFECPAGCGTFQYRERTRRLRRAL